MNLLQCIFILILKYSLLLFWGVKIFAHPSKLQCVVAKSVVDKHNADDLAAKRRKQFANFLSGGLAGTISSTLTAPLEVLIYFYNFLPISWITFNPDRRLSKRSYNLAR